MRKQMLVLWNLAAVLVFCSAMPCDAEGMEILPGTEFSFWNREETGQTDPGKKEEPDKESQEAPEEAKNGSGKAPGDTETDGSGDSGAVTDRTGNDGADEAEKTENNKDRADETEDTAAGSNNADKEAVNSPLPPDDAAERYAAEGVKEDFAPARKEENPYIDGADAGTGNKTSETGITGGMADGEGIHERAGEGAVASAVVPQEKEMPDMTGRPPMPCSQIRRPKERYGNPSGRESGTLLFRIAEEETDGVRFLPYGSMIPVILQNAGSDLMILSCQVNGGEAAYIWQGDCLMIRGKGIRNGENRIRIRCRDADGTVYESRVLTFWGEAKGEDLESRGKVPSVFHKLRVLIRVFCRKWFSKGK